jgi:hypothetical protein
MRWWRLNEAGRLLSVVLLGLLVGGCATQKIHWPERVGTYNLDQAVLEFGPPDKQAKLTDGTIVAEWLTRRGSNHLYVSSGYFPYWSGSPYSTYVDTYTPDYFLRLTFDPAGLLKSWKQFTR